MDELMKKLSFQPLLQKETGQSIVIIAVVMVALLAFVGLAIDLGLVWARRAQLVAAVDAAALAGVTEIETSGGMSAAQKKAKQFLYSNNIPASVVSSNSLTQYDQSANAIGATEFTVTSTWPIELYFMRLLGFETFRVSHSATAAYFPLVDIYASRRVELGTLNASNQAVFGSNCVTGNGDPFSPTNSVFRPANHYVNPAYSNTYFSYRYRIYIPPDYPSDWVRVEIYDPDTYNTSPGNIEYDNTTYTISRTQTAIAGGLPATTTTQCNRYRYDPCVKQTGETLDQNPFWFIRTDEIRQRSGGSCGAPSGNVYANGHPTQTAFNLYYYQVNQLTGQIQPQALGSYVGKADNSDNTDLRWVSPGGAQSYDQPNPLPAASGSFEVNLSSLSDIVVDQSTGARYLYLDVTAFSGASENGFEIWAGPREYASSPKGSGDLGCIPAGGYTVAGSPSKANQRNLFVANCGVNSHSSKGITVYGMGNLPMNSNANFALDIPLIYVGPEYAGSQILVSMFDPDSGARPPVVFHFDTLAFKLQSPPPASPANPVNASLTDWYLAFGVNNTLTADPDLAPGETRNCLPGGCQNVWITPAYRIQVPTYDPVRCVNQATTPQWCTPFYGGRLIAYYPAGQDDTYGWQIRLPGLPYLIK